MYSSELLHQVALLHQNVDNICEQRYERAFSRSSLQQPENFSEKGHLEEQNNKNNTIVNGDFQQNLS